MISKEAIALYAAILGVGCAVWYAALSYIDKLRVSYVAWTRLGYTHNIPHEVQIILQIATSFLMAGAANLALWFLFFKDYF